MGVRGYKFVMRLLSCTRSAARIECGLCGRALRGAAAIAVWALFGPAVGCAALLLALSPARVCGSLIVILPALALVLAAYALAAASCAVMSVLPCTRRRAERAFAADERVWSSVYNFIKPLIERKIRLASVSAQQGAEGGGVGSLPPPPPPPPPPPATPSEAVSSETSAVVPPPARPPRPPASGPPR